jgi:hypothetical protein
MNTFHFTVTIRARDAFYADQVRNEAVGGIEDAQESGMFEGGTELTIGELAPTGTDRDLAIIELARDRHCLSSSEEIQVEEGGIVSIGNDGAWVQGWLFVPNDALRDAGLMEEP